MKWRRHISRLSGLLLMAALCRAGAGSLHPDNEPFATPGAGLTVSRVALSEVRGEWTGDEGRVVWRLEAMWGTAGFHAYRLDPVTGAEIRLNDSLVPVAFYDPDAEYAIPDPAATEGGEGAYRLEEVELSGVVRDLGVFTVVFGPPPAKEKRVPASLAPRMKSMAAVAGPSDVLKVTLRQEGIYGVSWEAIAQGMGRPLTEIEDLALAGMLDVTRNGNPVPVITDTDRARLVFHGRPTTNWYVRDAAYMIRVGPGQAMPRRAPGAVQGVSILPASVRYEEDVYPFNGAIQRPADFYFWDFIISTPNPSANRAEFPVDLEGYAGGELTLKVDVQGWSQTIRNPDHLAEFWFNGMPLGSLAFNDQDAATAVLAVPPGVASNGANVLTVRGVLTNAAHHSYFVVDGITAEYDRHVAPGARPVVVRVGGAEAVSAVAFAEPLVLALDAAGTPVWIAGENGDLPSKAWAVAGSDERVAVVEAGAVPLLAPVPAAADAWFLSATNRVDYLVIAPGVLAATAQELAEYRAGQGLRTGVAVFEDVCDLMAGGQRTPEAIQTLMRYAAAVWAEPPRMLLLAGSGHYDYLETMGPEPNHLPPLLRQTFDGLFSSDERFGDIGGAELPDVAVGRLPARTPEELAVMIAKIMAYEADVGADWQHRLVFANDKADGAGNFAGSVARFTNLVQNPYSVSVRVNLDNTAIGPARAALLGSFEAGSGLVHYTGHGFVTRLSAQGLFTAEDVSELTHERTPVVVSLSCLVGHYEAPSVDSLAERLMLREAGGAVAVWASSALSLNAPATDLGEAFYQAVLQQQTGRLGIAILRARRSLPGDFFSQHTLATYNLFGDPALLFAGNAPADGLATPAQVMLQNLAQPYAGAPRAVSAATQPVGLAVRLTYDGQPDPPVLPGSYAVTGTVATATYQGMATGTLVVTKASAAIALSGLDQIYDGTPRSAVAVTDPPGLNVGFTYSALTNPPTAPGRYFVVATIDDPVYAGMATGALTIAKAPAAVTLNGLARTYDGAPKIVTAQTEPPGLSVSITYNHSPAAPAGAGSYTVVATVADAFYAGAATGALVVAKAPASVTLEGLFQVYDGTPRVVTATTDPDELSRDITYNGSFTAPTAAGWYAVTGSVWDPNWQGVATGMLAVAQAEQTIDFPPVPDSWTSDVVTLSATASSGLPVSFDVVAGPGVITVNNVLSFMSSGVVSIAATQAGDANWSAAPEVIRSFEVAYEHPIPELSARWIRVREGGEGRLHVQLPSRPKGGVAVSVERIAGDTNLSIRSGATLNFRQNDWNISQTVVFTAAPDDNADDETALFRVSAPGLSDVLVTVTALDGDIGPNLALAAGGATITGHLAANPGWAIDGLHTSSTHVASTIWTGAAPGSLTLDLSATSTLSRVRVLNADWTPAVQRYRMEGSRDGVAWTLLVDAATGNRSGWDDWPVAGTARYLRFTGLSNSVGSSVRIAEWEVYGTPWQKAPAAVELAGLVQSYDGSARIVTATTVPEGLAVEITYDGASEAPVDIGQYAVAAIVQDADYEGAAYGTLVVDKMGQTIHFEPAGAWPLAESMALSATASSGLPVAFAVDSGPGRLEEGDVLWFTGEGVVAVRAMQFGDAIWNPAPDVVRHVEAATPSPVPAGGAQILKVTSRGEGFQGVALEAIAAGMGLTVQEVRELAVDNLLDVRTQGRPVAVLHDAARDRIVFHGRPGSNWYTPDAVAMIGIGEGRAMPRRLPGADDGVTVFPVSVRFEEDRLPFSQSLSQAQDFFYWDSVTGTEIRHFPMEWTGPAGGDVTLRVRVMHLGAADEPNGGVDVLVNGQVAGSAVCSPGAPVELDWTVPAAWMINGTNTVSIQGVVLPGGSETIAIGLDWFEITGLRSLAPASGTVHFAPGAAGAVSAPQLSAPLVAALDAGGQATWIADECGGLSSRAWAVLADDERFAVAEADWIPMRDPVPVALAPWFLAASNRVDYLVLTSRALEPAAGALAAYREGQGLRVDVATFEDVCDWMADGVRTPEAIPALLAYAAETWTEAPWMMVLAGNGHYDYLNGLNLEINHIPPLLLETGNGLFAADGLMGDYNGDGTPDVAVGRLPARTASELADILGKIQAYEADFGAAWQRDIVLAADRADPEAGDFAAMNTQLAGLVDEPFEVVKQVDLDTTAVPAARTALAERIETGAGFVHYSGLGGADAFSELGLLKVPDVDELTNDRFPVVLALGGQSGRFEVPGNSEGRSLAEVLMQRAGAGAVAVWAPSAGPRLPPSVRLGEEFYRTVLQEGTGALGPAILRAARSLPDCLIARQTCATYNLLGDPALRIAGNAAGPADAVNFAQYRWQRLSPATLGGADIMSGTTDETLFAGYAMDGGYELEAEMPEYGFGLPPESAPGRRDFVLRWRRRIHRPDVDYQIRLSSDLRTWQEAPLVEEEVGVEPDPDGVMETVRTRIQLPDSTRVFIGVQARRR